MLNNHFGAEKILLRLISLPAPGILLPHCIWEFPTNLSHQFIPHQLQPLLEIHQWLFTNRLRIHPRYGTEEMAELGHHEWESFQLSICLRTLKCANRLFVLSKRGLCLSRPEYRQVESLVF